MGGWVGPRAGLDGFRKSRPPPGFDPRTVHPVVSRYTYYAILALYYTRQIINTDFVGPALSGTTCRIWRPAVWYEFTDSFEEPILSVLKKLNNNSNIIGFIPDYTLSHPKRLILLPWKRRRQVPPKRRSISIGVQDILYRQTVIIVIFAKTSHSEIP